MPRVDDGGDRGDVVQIAAPKLWLLEPQQKKSETSGVACVLPVLAPMKQQTEPQVNRQAERSYSFFSTRAVICPRASLAEIRSPTPICAESLTSLPAESKTNAYPRSRIATGESALS